MANGKAKHYARKVLLGEVWDTVTTGRDGPQGVSNVPQGGGTSSSMFWFGDMSTFGGSGEEGRGRTHRFS